MTEQITMAEKWAQDTIHATTPDGTVVEQPETPKDDKQEV